MGHFQPNSECERHPQHECANRVHATHSCSRWHRGRHLRPQHRNCWHDGYVCLMLLDLFCFYNFPSFLRSPALIAHSKTSFPLIQNFSEKSEHELRVVFGTGALPFALGACVGFTGVVLAQYRRGLESAMIALREHRALMLLHLRYNYPLQRWSETKARQAVRRERNLGGWEYAGRELAGSG